MKKYYYKVVDVLDGRLFSVEARGPRRLEYNLGKKTKALPYTRLFLYSNLSEAKAIAEMYRHYTGKQVAIFKCTAVDPKRGMRVVYDSSAPDPIKEARRMTRVSLGKAPDKFGDVMFGLSASVTLAKAATLVEEVDV